MVAKGTYTSSRGLFVSEELEKDQGTGQSPSMSQTSPKNVVDETSFKAQIVAVDSPYIGKNTRRRHAIRSYLPAVQAAPLRWLNNKFPHRRERMILFLSLYLAWALALAVLSDDSIAPLKVDGVYQPVQQLSCTDSFWSPAHDCEECPIPTGSVAFHCPADCATLKLQEPHLVGPKRVVDQSLVIGGPIYRADSWICASAVHAGIVEDSKGGCGILSRMGQTNTYPRSKANGISSVAVDTYFPLSFKFWVDSGFKCHIKDHRWLRPYVSIAFTVVVSLFTTAPLSLFATAIGAGFAQIESSQAAHLGSHSPMATFAGYLPALLCVSVVYQRSIRTALDKLTAQVEKTLFWLGAYWIGLLHAHKFHEHTFAVPISIVLIVLHVAHYLYLDGELFRSLPFYGAFLLILVASLASSTIPKGLLVIAAAILPGASLQTRPNLVYQGLLLGLLVHGLNDYPLLFSASQLSLFQRPEPLTPAAVPPPRIYEPHIQISDAFSNISFAWATPVPVEIDGISMLINDIERARHLFRSGGEDKLGWVRTPQAVSDYVRFSWVKDGKLLGYGEAGVWERNGAWTGPSGGKQ
jgi:hypothetical protein